MVRDLIVRNALKMFPSIGFLTAFQLLVDGLRSGVWNRLPQPASAESAVSFVVDIAMSEGWIKDLVAKIPRNSSNAAELDVIAQLLAAQQPTATDPFLEVLLEGNRPFVNRREFRERLRSLCRDGGATLLLVSGKPKTGKTFSFYLTQHAARQHEL